MSHNGMMPHIDSASDHQSAYRLRFQEIICIKNNLKKSQKKYPWIFRFDR